MRKQIINSVLMVIVMMLLTGLAYPLIMTGVAQAVFFAQANGSLVMKHGIPAGSLLIGQNFSGDQYFQGRPSAAGNDGYDATSSSGTNLGPTNQKLLDAIKQKVADVRKVNNVGDQDIPSDLVTSSGSGLDPHISPAAAALQVERVARARGMTADAVRQIVGMHTEERQWGIFGEPRVNVLAVNLALDAVK